MIGKRARRWPAVPIAAVETVAIGFFSSFWELPNHRVGDTPRTPAVEAHASTNPASGPSVESDEISDNRVAAPAGTERRISVVSFGEAYPEFVSVAASGERTAVIALARGLAACGDRKELRASYGNQRSRAERLTRIASSANASDGDRQAMDRSILFMDETKRRLDAKEAACAGVRESAIKARWREQLAAAKTGDADMIVDFVTHPAMNPREAFADDSGVRAFRENAPALLERIMRDGDLRGHQAYVRAGYDALLQREQYRLHDALSRVLKPDPVRVLAYDIALGQSGLAGPFGRGADHHALRDRQLDPAQRLDAEALARQIAPTLADSVSEWLESNPPRPRGE